MEKERIVVGETRDVEGIDLDTGIVSDIREGDGEIEIMMESIKNVEGRIDGGGSGEVMKGREAGIVGEKCKKVTTRSSAWPLLSSGKLSASSPLAFGFNLLFLCLVLRLILLMKRLIL